MAENKPKPKLASANKGIVWLRYGWIQDSLCEHSVVPETTSFLFNMVGRACQGAGISSKSPEILSDWSGSGHMPIPKPITVARRLGYANCLDPLQGARGQMEVSILSKPHRGQGAGLTWLGSKRSAACVHITHPPYPFQQPLQRFFFPFDR